MQLIPGIYAGEPMSWLDALFTSTSAVCVTGLIVEDTAVFFTPLGQGFILLLIQLGGLGILTFASLIIMALGQRLSLRTEASSIVTPESAMHLEGRNITRDIVRFTFLFEAIGDWQLVQFKRNPENKGKVMNTGLWKYTRHPNYFGDAFLWWGYYLFAFSAGGYWTIFSPILMTFLLMRVSGVALLEKKLVETKPQYLDYVKNTPAFFPRLWK